MMVMVLRQAPCDHHWHRPARAHLNELSCESEGLTEHPSKRGDCAEEGHGAIGSSGLCMLGRCSSLLLGYTTSLATVTPAPPSLSPPAS